MKKLTVTEAARAAAERFHDEFDICRHATPCAMSGCETDRLAEAMERHAQERAAGLVEGLQEILDMDAYEIHEGDADPQLVAYETLSQFRGKQEVSHAS